MKRIWIERTKPEELTEAFAWLKANADRNFVDWKAVAVSTLLKATNGERNVLHIPVRPAYVLESLAPNPQATSLELATGMAEAVKIVQWDAREKGIKEVCFLASDQATARFAERHGAVKVVLPLYKWSLE